MCAKITITPEYLHQLLKKPCTPICHLQSPNPTAALGTQLPTSCNHRMSTWGISPSCIFISRDQMQGIKYTRQVLYQWNTDPALELFSLLFNFCHDIISKIQNLIFLLLWKIEVLPACCELSIDSQKIWIFSSPPETSMVSPVYMCVFMKTGGFCPCQ